MAYDPGLQERLPDSALIHGWAVAPASVQPSNENEELRWQDSAGPLNVSFVGRNGVGHYRLRLGNDLSVDVLPDRLLETWQRTSADKNSLDHFLSDQVFPRLLAHGGEQVVHAGAIRAGGSAILLMGPSGRGKSTLAASFDQDGAPLLGDDAIVVGWAQERPFATSVYPSLRLLPDSIAALIPSSATTEAVAHYTAKRRVSLPIDESAAATPFEIAAIFVIGEPGHKIEIRQLSEAAASIALVSNSFALDPSDVEQARHRLAASIRLARAVTAYEIRYPRDYSRLPSVRGAIIAQIAR